ncbi:RNA-directed DNA polymerase, eukaryota, reverse transcriptase zinc-binding domain protein [Tanacetum coccineum]
MGIPVPDGDGDGIEIFIPVGYGAGDGMDIEIGDGDGKHDPRNTPTHYLQHLIRDVVLTDKVDSWIWSPNISKGYTAASAFHLIKNHTLELPSRVNLDKKGIDVDSLLCPICHEDVETVNHLFFTCDLAKDLWALLARWWELDIPFCTSISEWFEWLDSLSISHKARVFIEGVGGTLLWSIWSFRNRLVFSNNPPKKALIWDSIVSQSFLWFSSRNPCFKFNWVGWLQNPIATIASL